MTSSLTLVNYPRKRTSSRTPKVDMAMEVVDAVDEAMVVPVVYTTTDLYKINTAKRTNRKHCVQ
jgi:hypothetical protein